MSYLSHFFSKPIKSCPISEDDTRENLLNSSLFTAWVLFGASLIPCYAEKAHRKTCLRATFSALARAGVNRGSCAGASRSRSIPRVCGGEPMKESKKRFSDGFPAHAGVNPQKHFLDGFPALAGVTRRRFQKWMCTPRACGASQPKAALLFLARAGGGSPRKIPTNKIEPVGKTGSIYMRRVADGA